MRFIEVLTIVFIVLKFMGIIAWSWWLILLPEIIALVFYVVFIILCVFRLNKEQKNEFKY